jgi:hypothetical protein
MAVILSLVIPTYVFTLLAITLLALYLLRYVLGAGSLSTKKSAQDVPGKLKGPFALRFGGLLVFFRHPWHYPAIMAILAGLGMSRASNTSLLPVGC